MQPVLRAPAGCLALALCASAQVLPLERWDVPQGLPAARIACFAADARGYTWIGTWEGLALCDGASARAFGAADGLPTAFVNAIACDADGTLWVATKSGGLARLVDAPVPPGAPAFQRVDVAGAAPLEDASCLALDPEGRLWCGTDDGIWHVERAGPGWRAVRDVPGQVFERPGQAARAPDGVVWILAPDALYRAEHGRVAPCAPHPHDAGRPVGLVADAAGLLAGFDRGVWSFDPARDGAARWQRVDVAFPEDAPLRALARDAAGVLWLGTREGLVRVDASGARRLGAESGLPDTAVLALGVGADGLPWFGTWSAGACRLASRAVRSWTPACGLGPVPAIEIVLAPDGVLVGLDRGLAWIDAAGARSLAGSGLPPFDTVGLRVARDASDGWWIGTDAGLWRAHGMPPDLESAVPAGADACGPRSAVFGAPSFQGERVLWIPEASGRLVRAELDLRGRIVDCTSIEVGAERLTPRRVVGGPGGWAWILPYTGLARWRDGVLQRVELEPGGPAPQPRCALVDRAGALWIGTRFRGAWRSSDPAADPPRFERVPVRLLSEAVWALAEDARGGVLLATGRGVCRVDPRTWSVERTGVEGGLAGEIVNDLAVDAEGRVWCATSGGVSCIDPAAEPVADAAPATWIVGVRAAGADLALPVRGAQRADLGDLASAAAEVEVLVSAPGSSRPPAFEHRLDDGAWSEPRAEPMLRLAHLAPGAYRLALRARAGQQAGRPAELRFTVLPPWWRRPEVAAGAALLLALAAGSIWQTRRARQRALSDVRRRIADDVHDEVGAGLAQIAVLAEAARRGADDARLAEIARVARGLRGSVGEIVRALDPRPEPLASLAARARQLAANLFEAQGTEALVRAVGLEARAGLDPARRRALLLALQELLANAARHARASRVEVELRAEGDELVVRVEDDGVGFDPQRDAGGHGLAGLRRRAADLGGALELRSAPGAGTRAVLTVPLRGR